MNTPVKFEIAKLLKEKGFDNESAHYYNEKGEMLFDAYYPSLQPTKPDVYYDNPTIAEVVYWIYSKYDIWISLIPDSSSGHKLLDRKFSVSIFRFNINLNVQAEILRKDKNILYFNLPENAFEYTIEYILNTYKPTS